ncbi:MULTISPECIES: PDR/VanB family oxidoreductase [Actinomadura]|uniref:PDR/VanB family oxidoreductase n=1 Tax=Actinomadura yumaensis TaxID=111807 RepID=A0ABW2CXQ8_9ACTN|nr:PDR/VanB family oxidoreductase [Actinomadura sp. J1-007]MWK40528.1 2Fe-2S iron-sulfur cluster binding domain-containing protein [Actinomadura sp. J1-007]
MQQTILERVDRVAGDAVSLVLRGADGPLAAWEPGAHIDLALPNWLSRQYSLCGDPGERDRYRIAVRHDPLSRGGSEYVHLFLRTGRTLDVSSPRNNFPLLPAPEYLFLAGGIGVTPMVPMLRAAVEAGADATLVYAGRSAETMPFAEELRDTYGDRVRLVATRERGRPDLAALAAALGPRALVYCCGPASMTAEAEAVFPAERLHVERFRPAVKTFAPNTAFEVACARSGQTVEVPPEETLLDALNHAGRPVPAGCREGVCGSCEIAVLEGEPEHRDDIGAAPGRMYACVSRALSSRLVLDL